MKRFVLSAIAAAIIFVPATALSQDKDEEEGYSYAFEDDVLGAGARFSTSARIRVVPPAKRATLIRPRLHFIPELLKSVELL